MYRLDCVWLTASEITNWNTEQVPMKVYWLLLNYNLVEIMLKGDVYMAVEVSCFRAEG